MNTPQTTKKPSFFKSKVGRLTIAVVVSFICVCCVIAYSISSSDTTPTTSAVQPTNAVETEVAQSTSTPLPTAILDPKEALRFEITKVLGEGNRGVPKITAINFDDPETGAIFINWALDDNLTMEFIGSGARSDATEIVRALHNSGIDYTYVILSGSFSLVDEFGNKNEANVFNLTFNKSTIEKINWENFLTDNIDNIADDAFIRTELQDQ